MLCEPRWPVRGGNEGARTGARPLPSVPWRRLARRRFERLLRDSWFIGSRASSSYILPLLEDAVDQSPFQSFLRRHEVIPIKGVLDLLEAASAMLGVEAG